MTKTYYLYSSTDTARGASTLELVLVAFLLCLLGWAGIEVAHGQWTRQIVYVAALEAARAGAADNADPNTIQKAFADALFPLYGVSPNSPQPQYRWDRQRVKTGVAAWKIDIVQPSTAAFRSHSQSHLKVPKAGNRRVINNAYQYEQAMRQPFAQPSIFDANTLALRVTFLHTPLSSVWALVMRQFVLSEDRLIQSAVTRSGVIPIVVELRLEMQSHPIEWGVPTVYAPSP